MIIDAEDLFSAIRQHVKSDTKPLVRHHIQKTIIPGIAKSADHPGVRKAATRFLRRFMVLESPPPGPKQYA